MPSVVLAHVVYDDLTDPSADTAITTHHFEAPGAAPVAADYAGFSTEWNTFWTNISDRISNDIMQSEIRFYNISPTPGQNAGEAVSVDPLDRPGAEANFRLPPQVACSVTEETPIRRRWGRFYLPGFTVASVTENGRVSTNVVTDIADAAEDFYQAMFAANRPMIVLRDVDRTYQYVQSIRVDNVYDIIRRRRHSSTTVRAIRNLVV